MNTSGITTKTNESTLTKPPCASRGAQSAAAARHYEHVLVAEAQAGRNDAMNELLVRHRTAVYRAARRFTNSHEDAEDLVQDVMLRAFLKVGTFRNQSQFATWLISIANNAALSMKRRGRNVCFFSLDAMNEALPGLSCWNAPDTRPNPEQNAVRRELLNILRAVLRRQPQMQQLLVEECVFNEARIGDVASSLGLTIGSAKSKLFRTRRMVSDSFERRGLVKRPKTKKSLRTEP